MSLKKLLVSAVAAACAASLLIPAAYAHGGCHGRRNTQPTTPYRCAVCTVEGCTQTGRHYHDGVLYCGHNHTSGWCDGTCVSLCPVEGCTQTGRHYHDGVLYCGHDHASGWCDGTCCGTVRSSGSYWGGGHHGWHH